jgi:hypothetical protein
MLHSRGRDLHIIQVHLHISIPTIEISIHSEMHMKLTRFRSFSQSIFELELLSDIHSFRIPRTKIGVLSLVAVLGAELGILGGFICGVVTDSEIKTVSNNTKKGKRDVDSPIKLHLPTAFRLRRTLVHT